MGWSCYGFSLFLSVNMFIIFLINSSTIPFLSSPSRSLFLSPLRPRPCALSMHAYILVHDSVSESEAIKDRWVGTVMYCAPFSFILYTSLFLSLSLSLLSISVCDPLPLVVIPSRARAFPLSHFLNYFCFVWLSEHFALSIY